MKHIKIMISILLVGMQSFSQDNTYGTARYDGYYNATKGAFWATRPEAKMVYNGSIPPGVTVITLDKDYYVRFVEKEHNKLDGNYIIIPKGEKVYIKDGNYYAAICGNQIEYFYPVENEKIVKVPSKPDTVYVPFNVYVPKPAPAEEEKEEITKTTAKQIIHDTVYLGQDKVYYKKRTIWDALRNVIVSVSFYVSSGGGWNNYQPSYGFRGMPGGIPADPRWMPNNGIPPGGDILPGGIPADPRGMPNGLNSYGNNYNNTNSNYNYGNVPADSRYGAPGTDYFGHRPGGG